LPLALLPRHVFAVFGIAAAVIPDVMQLLTDLNAVDFRLPTSSSAVTTCPVRLR